LATVAAPPPVPAFGSGELGDHDLVAAVRAGDDRAFERLYQRYHRRIASYIYGMVKDYGRAEDIAQDVFMSALRRMRDTDRPIAFKPWIYEIAKNACIDQFRRSRRAEEVSYDADEGLGAADYGRLVQTGPTPDLAVDQKLAIDHLRGAFGGLSETHHEILVMRELEGLSYREIGERLGMSRPSVESTLFRARRRLTEEYEELVTGERCLRVQAIITSTAEGSLGARDQRKLARHISYCQPCRRHARMAGVDVASVAPMPVRAKIAALFPLPAFLKKRWGGGDDVSAAAASHGTQIAHLSAAVSQYMEPGIAGWAKAAAAAATVAVAGLGAGEAAKHIDLGLPGGSAGSADVRDSHDASSRAASSSGSPLSSTAGPTTVPFRRAVRPKLKGAAGSAQSRVQDSGGQTPPAAPVDEAPPIPDLGSVLPPVASAPESGGSGGSGGSGSGDEVSRAAGAIVGGTGATVPAAPPLPPPFGGEAGSGSDQAVSAAKAAGQAASEIFGGGG
jgi:RNA polymerase sigma factor (sigma-70 family)